ncbi:MAG: outer membrane protein assembly factor BamA [Bacteroidetes bacterium]|nr:outer membrane protein assembly factor BamA [Bacteroidota bacterium]
MKVKFALLFITLFCVKSVAQVSIEDLDYSYPKKYKIQALNVSGDAGIDRIIIMAYSGLTVGKEVYIPGDEISQAIKNLWKQKLFSNIVIYVDSLVDENIYLTIEVKTRPRLSRYSLEGISKSEVDKIKEKISLVQGEIVTQQLLQNVTNQITEYFVEKGYFNPSISIVEKGDTLFEKNSVQLNIKINKNKKIRIGEVIVEGNEIVKSRKIRSLLKKTKQYQKWNIFKSSKYIENLYEEDKERIIQHYNSLGYRDAKIVYDSVSFVNNEYIRIKIKIEEGNQYYFRNIVWTGNTKYSAAELDAVLGIAKGDIYNPELLEQKLHMSPTGIDISSIYMDHGYLFFSVVPVETAVDNDSIDLEIRLFEGPQATISSISISGNLRTSDHVILRELRTKPGEKFSRADIIRSQRELNQLGYFDPEQMNVIPTPDPENGTVTLEYKVVEKPSDQFQLQGGWGAGQFVGSLGFVFSNFSTKKMFKAKAWRPLPAGDGQRLSIRFQSNARYYSSFNFSFTEPWFGGRKPNAFSISLYQSFQSNGISKESENFQQIKITGATIGLGKRLKIPDDFFTLYTALTYQRYNLNNYQYEFAFTDGYSNNLNAKIVLARNSVDPPIYPRRGSSFTLSTQFSPPYSLFSDKDFTDATQQEKFKWMEYHKWRFGAAWYLTVFDKLVAHVGLDFGFLGTYNSAIGITPFERFYVGGSGLSGYHLDGRELIALRGYEDNSLTANSNNENGGTIFNKYTFEIRYPFSLNPSATIYALVFAEAGNSWLTFKEFKPFSVYRSLGAGVRIFMPMFGLLGFDWGYGFDDIPGNPGASKGQFHIMIGQQF